MAALLAAAVVYVARPDTASLRCLAPFKNSFSLLNPEFATHDADGSIFETWKEKVRFRRRRDSDRRRQDNGRRNASENGNFRPYNRGFPSASQGDSSGITHATNVAAAPTQPPAPSSAPALPQPSRLPLSCGMALRSRVTPTRTPADQVRFRCRLLLLVTVRRQCHIRSTVYGIIPRMPHSSSS